jgi:hypothetical protein
MSTASVGAQKHENREMSWILQSAGQKLDCQGMEGGVAPYPSIPQGLGIGLVILMLFPLS